MFLGDIQQVKSQKDLQPKYGENIQTSVEGGVLLASICEPLIDSATFAAVTSYVGIFTGLFALNAKLDQYIHENDFLGPNVDLLWIYLGNVKNELKKFDYDKNVVCVNEVTVTDTVSAYSSETQDSTRFNKTITIKTTIRNQITNEKLYENSCSYQIINFQEIYREDLGPEG